MLLWWEDPSSEPDPAKGNVNAVYFYSLEEIFASVEGSLFAIDEHAIGNDCLYIGALWPVYLKYLVKNLKNESTYRFERFELEIGHRSLQVTSFDWRGPWHYDESASKISVVHKWCWFYQ